MNSVENSYRLNDPDGSRSTEDGFNNIQFRTSWETRMQPVIAEDLSYRQGSAVIIGNYGVDNTGGRIYEEDKVDAKPDWIITFPSGKSIITEACVHPSRFSTISFKVSKLKKVTSDDRRIIVIRNDHYLVLDHKIVSLLLERIPVTNDKKIYGGKDKITFYQSDVPTLLQLGLRQYFYTDGAKKLIDPMLTEELWVGK